MSKKSDSQESSLVLPVVYSSEDLARVGAIAVGGRGTNDDDSWNDDNSDSTSSSDRNLRERRDILARQRGRQGQQGRVSGEDNDPDILVAPGDDRWDGDEPVRVVTAQLVDDEAEERRIMDRVERQIMDRLPRATAVVELTDTPHQNTQTTRSSRETTAKLKVKVFGMVCVLGIIIASIVVSVVVTMSMSSNEQNSTTPVLQTPNPAGVPAEAVPTEQMPDKPGQDISTPTLVPSVDLSPPTRAPQTEQMMVVISTRGALLSRIDVYLNSLQNDGSIGHLPQSWIPMRQWDISSISDCSSLFDGFFRNTKATLFNNPDISFWNTSGCTTMRDMFYGAEKFNQNLSSWDVSSVTDMSGTFRSAFSFNQDLSAWDVSSVTDMNWMFSSAASFNQDLSSWDVSGVTGMRGMFYLATFDHGLSSWDVSKVTDMGHMFSGAENFNQDLSSWSVSSVIDMISMFYEAKSFDQNLSSWDVSGVTGMSGMFAGATSFNHDLSTWDVSSVTDMRAMFHLATFNQDLSSWDVLRVTDMSHMFSRAKSFNQDLSSWNVSSVTELKSIFFFATSFNQNLCRWRETLNPTVLRDDAFFRSACPSTTMSDDYCHVCG